jgi:hypothetical protein
MPGMTMTANEKRRPATKAQRTVPRRSEREKAIDVLSFLEAGWSLVFSEIQASSTPRILGGAIGFVLAVQVAGSKAAVECAYAQSLLWWARTPALLSWTLKGNSSRKRESR